MNKTGKHSKRNKFSMSERMKSFRYAFRGMASLLRYEHNARIHLAILLLAIAAGILLKISLNDWMAILFVSGLVFISECFNTAIENLADLISDQPNDHIRRAKDVAAAGVILSAFISVAVGLIVFIPAVLKFLKIQTLL
jgi:diacylglycerol kinase (ATP)